jgi:DUF917 family protein
MGAPTAIAGVDFAKCAKNTYSALEEMVSKMDVPYKLDYLMPVELGGFNTVVPMLVSLCSDRDIPIIDADGCARAVPGLDTLLFHINGLNVSPFAMANDANDKICVTLEKPNNTEQAENIGRNICIGFGGVSGLAGWVLDAAAITGNLPLGTISKCKIIGDILLERPNGHNPFDELMDKGGNVVNCKKLPGDVFFIQMPPTDGGFDTGTYELTDERGVTKYRIRYVNENLLVEEKSGEEFKVLMTAPDIISLVQHDDGAGIKGMPLTNADIRNGMKVYAGVIQVDGIWRPDDVKKKEKISDMWKKYLEKVDYTGELVPYSRNIEGACK